MAELAIFYLLALKKIQMTLYMKKKNSSFLHTRIAKKFHYLAEQCKDRGLSIETVDVQKYENGIH